MPKKQAERTPEERAAMLEAYQRAEKALEEWWSKHPQGGTFKCDDLPKEALPLATMPDGPFSWTLDELNDTVVVPSKG